MVATALDISLYVRGDESIYIARSELRVRVYGPDASEHTHAFSDSAVMAEFLRWYTAALVTDGWVLHADVDRRLEEGLSPTSVNRRRSGPAPNH